MKRSFELSRRAMLRTLGAAVALPVLDVMRPVRTLAAGKGANNRLAYLYFPNGVPRGIWHPQEVGADGRLRKLNPWMSPLEPFKEDIIIPTNVWTPRGNGHGAGTATWLTGGGYDGRKVSAGGVSVDQLAAETTGKDTLLPSLDLSMRGEGYFSNSLPRNSISWTRSGIPVTREIEPRAVFDRMFRPPSGGATNRSVMDLVLQDAKSLRGRVSQADQERLDQYFESIRALEKRIEFAEIQALRMGQDKALTDSLIRPQPGIPSEVLPQSSVTL